MDSNIEMKITSRYLCCQLFALSDVREAQVSFCHSFNLHQLRIQIFEEKNNPLTHIE